MKYLKYKGYIGSVETDFDDNILYGKLLHIQDLVSYEADCPANLKKSFEEAVDDYLSECKQLGQEPDRPFKGQFNVRVSSALHRELALVARVGGKTLNQYVQEVLIEHRQLMVHTKPEPNKANFVILTSMTSNHQLSGGVSYEGSYASSVNVRSSKQEFGELAPFRKGTCSSPWEMVSNNE